MLDMEFRFLVCGLVLLALLFISYLKSMLQLQSAVTKTTGGQNNRFLQILNLTLFGSLLVVQISYVILWHSLAKDMVIVGCIRIVIEVAEKIVIFVLVR